MFEKFHASYELVHVSLDYLVGFEMEEPVSLTNLTYHRHEQNEHSKRRRNVGYVSKGKAIRHRP